MVVAAQEEVVLELRAKRGRGNEREPGGHDDRGPIANPEADQELREVRRDGPPSRSSCPSERSSARRLPSDRSRRERVPPFEDGRRDRKYFEARGTTRGRPPSGCPSGSNRRRRCEAPCLRASRRSGRWPRRWRRRPRRTGAVRAEREPSAVVDCTDRQIVEDHGEVAAEVAGSREADDAITFRVSISRWRRDVSEYVAVRREVG